ncbi:MAG: ATP-dependent Clp protease ATP-binding subunit [Candidatus Levybacteria bacterium]|nr:ATP-dependent Clp protease ATP-binding subunit [Candidatus Levybacteria bacterium]MDZ4228297.1 ATP-dependent Clp protease ATP-binding subunit [Candidatus Levybacteria bacterium]
MLLPFVFLKFWFIDSPKNLFLFFVSLNNAFLQLFSLPLLVKTYFKPWKNEYREGLVGFSIGMGMFIKTFVIVADLIIFLFLILIEICFVAGLALWPIAASFLLDNPPLFLLAIIYIVVIFFVFRKRPPFDFAKTKKSTRELIRSFLDRRDVGFFLQKAEVLKKEVASIEVTKDEILKNITGVVTPLDFFASYLLLTEEKTKLLFDKKLKAEDIRNICIWTKSTFPDHQDEPFRVNFWGEGIGESWVSGWTLETNKYMTDITSYAINRKPMIFGREEEYKEATGALSKNKSCLLVGDPGSGRGSFVNGLAYESFIGNLKGNLHHQRFFQLLTDALLAGATNQGILEERLGNILTEISHSGNIIIYIPNFENISGAETFNTDLSGALTPYLQKGKIRIIANITKGSYKKFIEPKLTLANVFETVKFEEPTQEVAFKMLLQKSSEIEKNDKVTISYKAVVAASSFANKYLQDRVMPGAGVTLLEDTVNAACMLGKKTIEEQDVINKVESKTKIAVGIPKEKEKALLLHLEEELSRCVIGQKDAVFGVSEALRRLRAGLGNKTKPISFLFMGPTGVGKTQTAKALSCIYYGGENKMIRFDMSEYSTDESVKRLLGGIEGMHGLTDAVFEHPFSLVLLDEFEKSNPKIIDLFLQVLDDGRLTDNTGRTVSFTDSIIIATSNAASEYIREEVNKGTIVDNNFKKKLLEFLQAKAIFRPELLNRFDEIIVFKPLGKGEVEQIIKLMLGDLSKKLLEKDITVNFDEKVIAKIANDGSDQEFGARPLRRFIQDKIEDLIAQKMLKDEIKRGDKISLSVDSANNLQLIVNG